MEQRKFIDEIINLPIGEGLSEDYKKEYTWADLLKTKNILDTDIVWNFYYKEEKESGFASMKTEDELGNYYYPVIQVKRCRPETDEEFLKRKQTEQSYRNKTEEQEKLEYLRLKAKFEPNGKTNELP